MMRHTNVYRWQRLMTAAARSMGMLAFCVAPLATTACSTAKDASSNVAVSRQAEVSADCGYNITTEIKNVNKKGFRAKIKVTNTTGGRLASPLSVLVNAGSAQLEKVAHGTSQSTSYGYLLTSIDPDNDVDDLDEASEPQEELLGKKYRFNLKFTGSYTQLTAIMMSVGGTACDQVAPTVSLTQSGNFFTANGTLSLTATAGDNVAVARVAFLQDGAQIGVSTVAPYGLSIPVTSELNGRHVYSAVAYDLAGNAASQAAGRVLVAIDNKFFGTAVATAADYAYFAPNFNQITPGNAGKWGSVEAVQGTMNWTDLDTAYEFAKANKIPFKFHTLIWGQQQPSWINGLAPADQLAAIDNWMAAVAARYPDIDMIDVVNEPMHSPPNYTTALGGAGATGWDWVITAFQMARSHFPNAELLLNDYYVLPLASFTQNYLAIVNVLKDRGLIDGIAEQGHFYERSPDLAVLSTNLAALAATGLPLYISELDLNLADDAQEADRMSKIFPIFWSNPSVVGVTHWGYLEGNMWQSNAFLLHADGATPRPALTWLRCYIAGGTDCPVPTYVPQPHKGNCTGITLQAPQFDSANGLLAAGNVVAYANDGSWFGYEQVAFQSNWNSLSVTYALGSTNPAQLSIYLGSLSSAPVATVPLAPTGNWSTLQTVTVPWSPLDSQQDVFVQFNGGGANVSQIQFTSPVTAPNIVKNGTFENGTSYWYTWSGATLATSTDRAHSGNQSLLVSGRTGNSPAATDITSIVKPGTNYPFSLWASIHTATGASSQLNVTQAATCWAADGVNSTTTYAWIVNPTTVPDGATWAWVKFSGTLSVPSCNLKQMQFWVEGADGSDPNNKPLADQLYIDDVQILDNGNLCPPSNLIPDGTFESGSVSSAWGGWGEAARSVVNTTAHSGTYSFKGTTMSSGALFRDITSLVSPGKKYQATAWVSVGNVTSGSEQVNWQAVQNCDSATSDSYPWYAGPTVSNGSWVQLSGTVDLTTCTKINKLLLFAGAASGDLYIDDVTLTAL